MKNVNHRIIAATPLISLFIFLIFGIYLQEYVNNAWLLGACAFFLIPINAIVFTVHWKKHVKSLIFLLSIVIFLVIGIQWGAWHPGWVVLLANPIYDLFATKRIDLSKVITVLVLTAYVVIGLTTNEWSRAWIIIFLIPISSILLGPNSILDFSYKDTRKKFSQYVHFEKEDDEDDKY